MGRYVRRSLWSGAGAGLLAAVTAAAGAGPALAGGGESEASTLGAWLHRHAVALRSADPGAPLDDLAPLRRAIGDAQIVGLGESTHGAAEQTTLKHRALRLLVEQMGFRTVAWEDDWTLGLQVDSYLKTGEGDPAALLQQMSTAWRSSEVAAVLQWLRDFNAGRAGADQVSFVGVEYFSTRPLAYDAVDAYVAASAPERRAELRRHLLAIRPDTEEMGRYVRWYFAEVADKAPYIDHARQVYALVDGLPHGPGDRAHALALHHARQIVSFYEHFALPDNYAYRDDRAAQNLRWWHDHSGDKVAYWAASAHTADAPELVIAAPPRPDIRFASAGSHLRRWYGERYRSIGFTCDRGAVRLGSGGTAAVPPPAPDWFERPLGGVGAAQFALDLRAPAPPAVRSWRDAPLRTRGLPELGLDSYMAGGTLARWFDVLVHRQEVTPVLPA